jgi:RimJ/RimL family protein N-acetyltransferase
VDGARGALCGFCFFDEAGKTKDARDLGMLGLCYWFEAMRVDVIHGIMLESNVAASNFAERLGFSQVALVPKRHFHKGELVGARVMMIEKATFREHFEEWVKSHPLQENTP